LTFREERFADHNSPTSVADDATALRGELDEKNDEIERLKDSISNLKSTLAAFEARRAEDKTYILRLQAERQQACFEICGLMQVFTLFVNLVAFRDIVYLELFASSFRPVSNLRASTIASAKNRRTLPCMSRKRRSTALRSSSTPSSPVTRI
jgi:hypothetical protein